MIPRQLSAAVAGMHAQRCPFLMPEWNIWELCCGWTTLVEYCFSHLWNDSMAAVSSSSCRDGRSALSLSFPSLLICPSTYFTLALDECFFFVEFLMVFTLFHCFSTFIITQTHKLVVLSFLSLFFVLSPSPLTGRISVFLYSLLQDECECSLMVGRMGWTGGGPQAKGALLQCCCCCCRGVWL